MSIVASVPTNTRLIEDTNYIVYGLVPTSLAAGAAAGSASFAASGSTPALDFIQAKPYPTTETVIVRIDSSVITGLSGSNAITFNLQHSDDNVTFVNIPELSTALVSSTNNSGTASAGYAQVLLPPSVKRYVRAAVSVPATGSLSTGLTGSYTASVLF